MNLLDRARRAHQLVAEGAAELDVGNDPASGIRLLARAMSTNMTTVAGPTATALYFAALAKEALGQAETR